MKKDSTIFYESQIDICRKYLNAEQFGRLMFALFEGEDIEVDEDIAIFYDFMILQVRLNAEKYQRIVERNRVNGKKGGAPKGNKNAAKKANTEKTTQNNPNENDNENENENGNESVPDSVVFPSPSSSLVSYLNEKTGSSYRLTAKVQERIDSLLSSGYSYEDMVRVIDTKAVEWSGSEKMRAYLRPSTLFGDKFEEYASAPIPIEVEREQKRQESVAVLKARKKEAEELLAGIEKAMRDIEATPEGIRGHWNRYEALADDKILTEQEIRTITERLEGSQ